MKIPFKPRKPTEPAKPSKKFNHQVRIVIYDYYPITNFLNKIPEGINKDNVYFRTRYCDYDGSTDMYLEYTEEREKSPIDYDKEFKVYEKKLNNYNKSIKLYNEQMKLYNAKLKEYREWKNKEDIVVLESKLKKLKGNEKN